MVFFHPDFNRRYGSFTVLQLSSRTVTAGGDFHPAPNKSIITYCICISSKTTINYYFFMRIKFKNRPRGYHFGRFSFVRAKALLLVPLIGLEPIRSYPSRDFKSLASACSATTAKILEAPSRFELENKGLQTSALPLGYGALRWSGRRDSNPRHLRAGNALATEPLRKMLSAPKQRPKSDIHNIAKVKNFARIFKHNRSFTLIRFAVAAKQCLQGTLFILYILTHFKLVSSEITPIYRFIFFIRLSALSGHKLGENVFGFKPRLLH